MSELYITTWLACLAAFLVGVALAWLVRVRPQQRRIAAAGAAPDAPEAAPAEEAPAAAAEPPPAVAREKPPQPAPAGSALASLDTGGFRKVPPAPREPRRPQGAQDPRPPATA